LTSPSVLVQREARFLEIGLFFIEEAMEIPLSKLAPVAEAVRQLRDALRTYCLSPDKIPVSMEDLKFALEQMYQVKVRTIMVRTKHNSSSAQFNSTIGK
jgi:hypothetical protein